jgi:hypothetical protein
MDRGFRTIATPSAHARTSCCASGRSLLAQTAGGLYIVAGALVLELVRALSDICLLFSGIPTIGPKGVPTAADPGEGED